MESRPSDITSQADAKRPVRIMAITAGKGGVGKTNIAVNLACARARAGSRVLLIDGDLSLANVAIFIGAQPTYNLEDVLLGHCALEDTRIKGPYNIDIIPGASGSKPLSQLNEIDYTGIFSSFEGLLHRYDYVFIDTPAGLSTNVKVAVRSAQEVILVVCNEPASITDAYALMKIMSQVHRVTSFQLITNMVSSLAEGRALFQRLSQVSSDFLDITIHYLGAIPFDAQLQQSIRNQEAIFQQFPNAASAKAFTKLSRALEQNKPSVFVETATPMFLESLFGIESTVPTIAGKPFPSKEGVL